MRKYPATLIRVFENKLEDGADTDDNITFDKADLERATDDLDIDVRQVLGSRPRTVRRDRSRAKSRSTTTSISSRTSRTTAKRTGSSKSSRTRSCSCCPPMDNRHFTIEERLHTSRSGSTLILAR